MRTFNCANRFLNSQFNVKVNKALKHFFSLGYMKIKKSGCSK